MNNNDAHSRFSDPVFEIVTNNSLQCADCKFLMEDSTVACEKYLKKPGYVIYGLKPCPQYCKHSKE